jgi:hypothetical protein
VMATLLLPLIVWREKDVSLQFARRIVLNSNFRQKKAANWPPFKT